MQLQIALFWYHVRIWIFPRLILSTWCKLNVYMMHVNACKLNPLLPRPNYHQCMSAVYWYILTESWFVKCLMFNFIVSVNGTCVIGNIQTSYTVMENNNISLQCSSVGSEKTLWFRNGTQLTEDCDVLQNPYSGTDTGSSPSSNWNHDLLPILPSHQLFLQSHYQANTISFRGPHSIENSYHAAGRRLHKPALNWNSSSEVAESGVFRSVRAVKNSHVK